MIRPTAQSHEAYQREVAVEGETAYRFVLKDPEDERREMTVSILVFDVPA